MGRMIYMENAEGGLILGYSSYGDGAIEGIDHGGLFTLDAENAEKLRRYLAGRTGKNLEEKLGAEFGKTFDATLFRGICRMRGITFGSYSGRN